MKKVIYLAAPPEEPPTYESVELLRLQAAGHLAGLTSRLGFKNRQGRLISIEIAVDAVDPSNRYFYNACAAPAGENTYKVRLGGGLLARLDALSRALTADRSILKGCTRTILLTGQVRKHGRPKAMADFAFYCLLDLVFWHEVAHIVLGHVDWLISTFGCRDLAEMAMTALTPDEIAARIALEGDADRQSALWSVSMFDYIMDRNDHLRYQAKADAFHDFGYLASALFMMLDGLRSEAGHEGPSTHPENNERIGMLAIFSEAYLRGAYSAASKHSLHESIVQGVAQALRHIIHANRQPLNLLEIVRFAASNTETVERLGVRRFQLVANPDFASSFDLSRL